MEGGGFGRRLGGLRQPQPHVFGEPLVQLGRVITHPPQFSPDRLVRIAGRCPLPANFRESVIEKMAVFVCRRLDVGRVLYPHFLYRPAEETQCPFRFYAPLIKRHAKVAGELAKHRFAAQRVGAGLSRNHV